MIGARHRGEAAFWTGKELFSNPHTAQEAKEWREGWHTAEADFEARGGQVRTAEELVRLRPSDLKIPRPKTHTSTRARGKQFVRQARAMKWWGS